MTIREIALECGVSTATVDRVINGRGRVKPETEIRVLEALEKAGYSKNIAARALAIHKAAPVVGVVVSSEGNPFFDDVLLGIRRAAEELIDYGIYVSLSSMRGYEPQRQIELIEEMEPRISTLVLQPIDDPRIAQKITDLADKGIPTVTINSDLDTSRRRCYVGSDYVKGGKTAAGLMRMVIQGTGRLGILTGVDAVQGHRQRLWGFEDHLRKVCPDIRIVARRSAEDDDERAFAATRAMLLENPSIDTILLVAAGLRGVCAAIAEMHMEEKIRMFAFDNIPSTEAMMQRGFLKAVVCQQPFQQGYQAARAAMDIILSGGPAQERLIMENQICILENLRE